MGTGAVVVLIGLIFAALALLSEVPVTGQRNDRYPRALFALAVILIGIGVLVGHTQFTNK